MEWNLVLGVYSKTPGKGSIASNHLVFICVSVCLRFLIKQSVLGMG